MKTNVLYSALCFWSLFATINCFKVFPGRNGKLYFISHPLQLNWQDAYKYCADSNLALVSITNAQDEQVIQNIIQSSEYNKLAEPFFWTGANDLKQEGKFVWESIGQPVTYSNWTVNQPDNYGNGEDCVEIRGLFNYKWNDHICGLKKYFICESVQETCEKCDECQPVCKPSPMLWYAEPISFEEVNEGLIKIQGNVKYFKQQP